MLSNLSCQMTHFVVFSMEILCKIASRSVVFNLIVKEKDLPAAERRVNTVFCLIHGDSLAFGCETLNMGQNSIHV
jgi:hypothetical protein